METVDQCILCESPHIEVFCRENLFSKCTTCGHFFDNPRPDDQEVYDFYSKEEQYSEWLSRLEERSAMWRQRLNLILKHKRSGKLLDIGAGIGQFLQIAKGHFEVQGTEISETAVGLAKSLYGLELQKGTLEQVGGDQKFDVISLFHVLEHVPYPKQTLERCYSLLEKKGVLVIAVPNDVDSILTRRNRMMRRLGFKKYRELGELGMPRLNLGFAELHLSHFTAETLNKAVQSAGFKVLESSLDPYFAVTGKFRKFRRHARFHFYRGVTQLTKKNLYDTVWMVAQKQSL